MTIVREEENGNNGHHVGGVWRGHRCSSSLDTRAGALARRSDRPKRRAVALRASVGSTAASADIGLWTGTAEFHGATSVNTPTWPSRRCPAPCSAPPAAGAAAPGSRNSGRGHSVAGRPGWAPVAAAAGPRPGRSGRPGPGAGRRTSYRGGRRTGCEPFRATAVTWPRTPSATKTPRRSVSPERNEPLPRADHLDLDLRHELLGARIAHRHADSAALGLLQHLELQRRDQHDPRGVEVVAADHHEVGPFPLQGQVDGADLVVEVWPSPSLIVAEWNGVIPARSIPAMPLRLRRVR